jgi:hypothetical protein
MKTKFIALILMLFSLNCFGLDSNIVDLDSLNYSSPISDFGFGECFKNIDSSLNTMVNWTCTVVSKQEIDALSCFGLVNGTDIYRAKWVLVLNYQNNKCTGLLALSNEDLSYIKEGMLINVEGKILGVLEDNSAGSFLVLAAKKIIR